MPAQEFIAAARSLLTTNVILAIAEKTEGFSPNQLENMVDAIRDSARATKSDIITQTGIDNAISRALIERQNAKKNKEQYAKMFDQEPEQQKPMTTPNH
jgi:hypothetical protein